MNVESVQRTCRGSGLARRGKVRTKKWGEETGKEPYAYYGLLRGGEPEPAKHLRVRSSKHWILAVFLHRTSSF
jgi:hypothetical protein